MPRTAKKTTKVKKVSRMASEPSVMTMPAAPIMTARKSMDPKILRFALVVIVIALLTYKLGPWLVPSIVDNRPITRFALWSRLEQTAGAQTLDDMVNEKILDGALAKAGIKVDQGKIDAQMLELEDQFKETGGLDEALKQRGLTRDDLEKQVKTQLSVEELLADKIVPTDEEIQQEYDANATTLYADKKLEEVKDAITTQLKDTKLRDAFLSWFEGVKAEAKVKNFGL